MHSGAGRPGRDGGVAAGREYTGQWVIAAVSAAAAAAAIAVTIATRGG
jgi:hypothetical protein